MGLFDDILEGTDTAPSKKGKAGMFDDILSDLPAPSTPQSESAFEPASKPQYDSYPVGSIDMAAKARSLAFNKILQPDNDNMPANPQESILTNPTGVMRPIEKEDYHSNLFPKKAWDTDTFIKKDIPNVIQSAPEIFDTGMAKTVGGIGQFLGEDTSGGESIYSQDAVRPWAGTFGDPRALTESSKALIAGAQESENEIRKQFPVETYAGKMVQGAVTSVLQQAPSLVLSTVAGQPWFGLSIMGVQSFGTQYAEDRAKGRSPEDSAANAAVQLITEPGTEVLPFVKFAKGMKQGWSTKVLKDFVLGEQAGEHVAQAVEGAFDVAFDEKDPAKRTAAAIDYLKSHKHLDDQVDVFWTTLIQSGLMGVAGKGFTKLRGQQDLSPEMEKEHDEYTDVKASAAMYETLFGKPAPVQPVKPTWLNEETKPFLPQMPQKSDFVPEALNPSGIGTEGAVGQVANDKAWEQFNTPEGTTPVKDQVEVPNLGVQDDNVSVDQAISDANDVVNGVPVGSKSHQESLLAQMGGSDVTAEGVQNAEQIPSTTPIDGSSSAQPEVRGEIGNTPEGGQGVRESGQTNGLDRVGQQESVDTIISQANRAINEGKDYPTFARDMAAQHGFENLTARLAAEQHKGLNDAWSKAEQQQAQIADLTAQMNNIALPQNRREQAKEALAVLQAPQSVPEKSPSLQSVEQVGAPAESVPSTSPQESSEPEAKFTTYRRAEGKWVPEQVSMPASKVVAATETRKSILESLLNCIGGA